MKFPRLLFLSVLALFFQGAFPVRAQQGGGYLKVKTSTGRAGVFIDGKYVGPAANFRITRKYPVPAGEHEVKLSEPRYEEYTTKVTINAGKTTTISQALKPAPVMKPPYGMLRVEGGTDKFAAVFVNDRFMGHVDEFSNPWQRLLLNPGEYTVKIVSPGNGQEHEEKVAIKVNETTTVKLAR